MKKHTHTHTHVSFVHSGTCAVVSRPAMRKFKTRSLQQQFLNGGAGRVEKRTWKIIQSQVILLMEEILHHLIGIILSHYLQGFSTIPGGCWGFLPSTVSR